MGVQSNAQREVQLLAEWLGTLPAGWRSKTHIRVGSQTLVYQGVRLSPARARAFEVWSDWADVRVFTGTEVWIVEAKIVGTAEAYGQVLDYCQQYPESEDYQQFAPAPIAPLVLCAFEKRRSATYFARFGVRTVIFTPTWAATTLATKVFGSLVDL
jgi:hypothetical protein